MRRTNRTLNGERLSSGEAKFIEFMIDRIYQSILPLYNHLFRDILLIAKQWYGPAKKCLFSLIISFYHLLWRVFS